MKLGFFLGTAVLAVALPVAAASGPILLAQNDQHHEEHKTESGQQHGGNQGGQQHNQGQPGHAPVGQGNMAPHGQMGGHNNMTGQGQTNGGQMNGGQMRGGQNRMNGNAMMGRGHAPANFDRHTYQRNFEAPRHYHVGVYVRPQGWYAHRWVYGEILPNFFWTQNYWLADYYDYGLADPPPGFVWVRYGDDALLIDQNSGEVLQVEYEVFD